jgi:hypothetical protein
MKAESMNRCGDMPVCGFTFAAAAAMSSFVLAALQ